MANFILFGLIFLVDGARCYRRHEATHSDILEATLATEAVQTDPDDVAIWIDNKQPESSLLIATDKKRFLGGLYVFDMNGKIRQHFENLDRPNNVDVEYGFRFNETTSLDIVVVTERGQKRLLIFAIDPSTHLLYNLTGSHTNVFINDTGDYAAPMGVALYKRPTDGRIDAIISRKAGPKENYLGQYELISNGTNVDLRWIRYFGCFQGSEIESIVIDDHLGFIYYSDENYGIRKYRVDADESNNEQIGFINTTGLWQADSEGLALYATSINDGYLIATDQIENGSIFHIFHRQGNNSYIRSIQTRADSTDGIEATSHPLGDQFPHGLLIVMNEKDKNFLIYDWRQIENGFGKKRMNDVLINLELCLIYFVIFSF